MKSENEKEFDIQPVMWIAAGVTAVVCWKQLGLIIVITAGIWLIWTYKWQIFKAVKKGVSRIFSKDSDN